MTARSTPDASPGFQLRIPATIWARALDTITEYGRVRSEALMMLAGVVASDDVAIVTCLYLLDHLAQGECVVVDHEESRWLLRSIRARDEKLLAQVHSHPGEAFHSGGDDASAASFHPGYLSIVVPQYGRRRVNPADCAVVEWRSGRFVELTPNEVSRRIQLVEGVERRRSEKETGRRRWWDAFVQRLSTIARRRP